MKEFFKIYIFIFNYRVSVSFWFLVEGAKCFVLVYLSFRFLVFWKDLNIFGFFLIFSSGEGTLNEERPEIRKIKKRVTNSRLRFRW